MNYETVKVKRIETVKVKRINEDAPIPKYAKDGDSGVDLYAMENVLIFPGQTVVIPVGLSFEPPEDVEIQVRPRSGLSSKTTLRVILGTGDPNFRGEYGVIADNIAQLEYYYNRAWEDISIRKGYEVLNLKGEIEKVDTLVPKGTIIIHKGDKIAQAVFNRIVRCKFEEVDELSKTERGADGFGSTGVN